MPKASYKVIAFIVIAFILVGILAATAFTYMREYNNEKMVYETREAETVSQVKDHVNTLFALVVEDLVITSRHIEIEKYVDTLENENKENITKELTALSQVRKFYDQVRYLDETGMEVIRINRTANGSVVVPEKQLQNKAGRYYFDDTLSLGIEEIFVSPLDLNMERGEIEQPIKPMIRIGTPVFNNEGEKMGILLLNYLGKDLLEIITQAEHDDGSLLELINKDGYWLRKNDPEKEWGFMYEDKLDTTFQNEYPEAWLQMADKEQVQFYTDEGLFTVDTIYPFTMAQASSTGSSSANSPSLNKLDPEEYSWKIISFIPNEVVHANSQKLLRVLALLIFTLLIVIGGSYYIISKNIDRRLAAEEKVIKLNKLLEITNKILRHDLANHFTAIRSAFDLYGDDPQKEYLQEANDRTLQGIAVIRNMRELENIAKTGGDLIDISVEETLNKVSKELNEVNKTEINITGAEGVTVKADQAFEAVCYNITSNAINHGKTKKIDIQVSSKKGNAEIKFIDYGTGIPDEIKGKIFDEGFTHGESGNSGLGLYIVNETIKRYNGSIKVTDNKPKGTIFTITLPA